MGYDAFISYSHGADGDLASDLQASLERFSKPWYRRKPFLSVLRDATSFGASSSLEGTIHEALGEADHFVLLLSPESAESPWINDEVAHWVTTRGVENMTFAITRWRGDDLNVGSEPSDLGKFRWDGEDVPAALHGAVDEPLAVDLRWAHTDPNRTLKNERWRDGVAEIAAGIRDQNKDELIGSVVAMRARARILTGTLLLGLAILTAATALGVGGWVLANRARTAAVEERQVAESQQVQAEAARDQAQAAESAAVAQAGVARQAQQTAEEAAAQAEAAAAEAGRRLATAEAAVAAAEADLATAQSDLETALADLTTTATELAAAQTNLAVAEQDLLAAKQDVAAAERDLAAAKQELVVATAEVERQTQMARSIAVSSRSISLLDEDQPAAALVALAAFQIEDTPQARDALATLEQRSTIAASLVSGSGEPLGRYAFAFLDGERIVVADDQQLGIYDPRTSELLSSLSPAPAEINDMAYSEVSGLLAVADDEGITVHDVDAETTISRFSAHRERPTAVAWGPDGRQIASTSTDELFLWDALTGDVTVRRESPHELGTSDVAVSPAGDVVVTSGQFDVAFWDETGTLLEGPIDTGASLNFVSLAFSPDGTLLASNSSVSVLLWDAATRTRIGELLHADIVTAFSFSHDGSVLATSAIDETVRLWDPATSAEIGRPLPTVGQRLEFSPDDLLLAVGATVDLPVVDVSNLTSGPQAAPGGPAAALSNGGVLAVAEESTVRFLAAQSGQSEAPDVEAASPVTALAFDATGTRLAVAADTAFWVYDLMMGAADTDQMRVPGSIERIAFSESGGQVVAASTGQAWLIDLATGTIELTVEPSVQPVQSAVFASSDTSLIVASGRVDLLFTTTDIATGATSARSWSLSQGLGATLTRNGEVVAVDSGRDTIRLYDGSSGEPLGDELGELLPPGLLSLPTVVASPDGENIAFWTPTSNVWRIVASGTDTWTSRACHIAGRNLTLTEWERFVGATVPYAAPCPQFPSEE